MNIVPEAEWDAFMGALRKPLPATFRITGTRSEAFELRDLLKKRYFSKIKEFEAEGGKITVPKPLPWYPNELGWHFESSRVEIRKSTQYSGFHAYLVQETAMGNISRQEAVSMIPPILLDVQSHHRVLDMCAAPGSKTSQLIEFLHTGCGDKVPEGFVIANDDSHDRCYTLIHQTKRLRSPCTLIANHDASQFPTLYVDRQGISVPIQFDRILADVPCSGDGTLRKNPLIWKKWTLTQGPSLHPLQVRILKRGCQLLKVGGRLVYSTCSLNPVENEAVVATILREFPDVFELVDARDLIPELKRAPGMRKWKLVDKLGREAPAYQDLDPEVKGYLHLSMFPPTEEEANKMNLERCLRILPHQQDTGGFFVAVLRKKGSMGGLDSKVVRAEALVQAVLSGEKTSVDAQAEEAETSGPSEGEPTAAEKKPAPKLKPKLRGKAEAPFVFVDEADKDLNDIKNFFALDNFPFNQLLIRSNESVKKRQIYFVNAGVREILAAKNRDQLNVVHTGLRMFSRNEHDNCKECDFRLGQDAIQVVSSFLTAQRVEIQEADFVILLNEDYPLFSSMTKEASQSFEKASFGSCLIEFDPSKQASENCLLKTKVMIAGWKGLNSGAALLVKADRLSYLSRFENVVISEKLKPKQEQGRKRAKTDKGDKNGDAPAVESEEEVEVEGEGEGED